MSLPFLFVIGDSISIQYGPYLQQYLSGKVTVTRKGDLENTPGFDPNGRDSNEVLDYARSLLERPGFRADLLLVNCGLHDIKRSGAPATCQVPPDQYRANLTELLLLVARLADRMVWVATTPVDDETHNSRNREFQRWDADVVGYNQSASEIMRAAGIPIIDLYAFTRTLGSPQEIYEDHVHFQGSVQRLQGAFIAGSIAQIIERSEQ